MIKILKYGEIADDEIFARTEPSVNVEGIVSEIIENVKKNGDAALFAYCEKLTELDLSGFDFSRAEMTKDMFFNCLQLKDIHCTVTLPESCDASGMYAGTDLN